MDVDILCHAMAKQEVKKYSCSTIIASVYSPFCLHLHFDHRMLLKIHIKNLWS